MRELVRECTQPLQIFVEYSQYAQHNKTTHTHCQIPIYNIVPDCPLYDRDNRNYRDCNKQQDNRVEEDSKHGCRCYENGGVNDNCIASPMMYSLYNKC